MTKERYIKSSFAASMIFFVFAQLIYILPASAQIGEYRNSLSLGVNGGYVLSNVGFTPKVPQTFHSGVTMGLSARYVCEKYFNTICSIVGEINYSSIGWKEDILDSNDQEVINSTTGLPEKYQRTINYIQVPLFAHLAWGKEKKGMQFFVQAGPQFGIYLTESTSSNFSLSDINIEARSNTIIAQDSMSVERKFDYGIAVGVGMEYSHQRAGHFLLEARYYYGLANIYDDSKKDYFGKSNFGNIIIKATYLFDITGKKNKTNK